LFAPISNYDELGVVAKREIKGLRKYGPFIIHGYTRKTITNRLLHQQRTLMNRLTKLMKQHKMKSIEDISEFIFNRWSN